MRERQRRLLRKRIGNPVSDEKPRVIGRYFGVLKVKDGNRRLKRARIRQPPRPHFAVGAYRRAARFFEHVVLVRE